MRLKLYQKVFGWFALNLLLLSSIAVGLIVFILFKGSDGLLPPYLFNSDVEIRFQAISATLQHKPMDEWGDILREYTKDFPQEYTIYDFAGNASLGAVPPLPLAVREVASRMPRIPVALYSGSPIMKSADNMPNGMRGVCRYEDELRGQTSYLPLKNFEAMEAGIPPPPRVIYMRTEDPVRYWFGQGAFIPDERGRMHYMLLAVSAKSFSGGGLFFDTPLIGSILLLAIIISCLWWWPFVHHISKPLLRMAGVAEALANNECRPPKGTPPGTNICAVSHKRKDEIGRLAEAIDMMARQLGGVLSGQRLFIHHVAHEINSPLARIKLGLAVLEDRLGGESKTRVQRLMDEMECLSLTTDGIISFLRSHTSNQAPLIESFSLCRLLTGVITKEAGGRAVGVDIPAWLRVKADPRYVDRAFSNILRNAIKYTDAGSLVTVSAASDGGRVVLEIRDNGRGVSESDFAMLTEPFYRGFASRSKNGVGLGLSIARLCIEACGGSLEFAANEPTGLTVRIWLVLACDDDIHKCTR